MIPHGNTARSIECGWVVFLRCCGKRGRALGLAAVALGTFILLALILPGWFWWLVCGAALLTGGILLLRR